MSSIAERCGRSRLSERMAPGVGLLVKLPETERRVVFGQADLPVL
jgi:hypothetical protein